MSVKRLCGLFGKSRQHYYKLVITIRKKLVMQSKILQLVDAIRAEHPRIGTRKLHHMLAPILAQIGLSIGRDRLFQLLDDHGLLLRMRTKSGPKTTDPSLWGGQYPDLLYAHHGLPEKANGWVCDITYVRTKKGFVFLALITDIRSRKIIGHHTSESMETAKLCLPALQMAIKQTPAHQLEGTIHHSDRGKQYLEKQYCNLLKSLGMHISMTQRGNPRDNAIAERVNGILKNEYLFQELVDLKAAARAITKSKELYNTKRPHTSLGFKTPQEVWLENQKSDIFTLPKNTGDKQGSCKPSTRIMTLACQK